ncbi:MAG TPA: glycoside hydrolase family 57 protein [Terriglobales bacterium]|nr:glycoside hydrolase family 57 protein [Terriglobales bacterium]
MIRIVFLWHMHQPFYKDLVTGHYRLPWVRMHGLKDYYGMVKLLDEFPQIHQTFNMVPSLVAQLQDYVQGGASDPFLSLAAKPANELSEEEQRFALEYLFHANQVHMIGRYPRYNELFRMAGSGGDVSAGLKAYCKQDYTDLQVLSQLAWFDEFFLAQPDVQALAKKGRDFSLEDQAFVMKKQTEILAAVMPAYASAAQRGGIEVSCSPYYHPILPLLCDTDKGRESTPGLPLPKQRFQHPEDAREQLRRGMELHEKVFGVRPKGVWPSEGSVSDDVMAIGHQLGVQWMATDEGVLGRSTDYYFDRAGESVLTPDSAERLYNIYRFEQNDTRMHMIFRDHSLSDLIGFVYSGMNPHDSTQHFLGKIKASAADLTNSGRDAVVPVILDGENAWEYFPGSGREFLRRLYSAIQVDPQLECVTVSEAIERHDPNRFGKLTHLVPGSWINSNFNVWIGAPEDNLAWDYLHAARELYEHRASRAPEDKRKLAFEELMIAEGSDWNWWYGPEHHSANDRDFDELYRKHLSNVYVALGENPPDYLSRPIAGGLPAAKFTEQVAFIHPRIDGKTVGYFDWLGAAEFVAPRSGAAMHGKKFVLDKLYAGIDDKNLYCRVDFVALAAKDGNGSSRDHSRGDFEVQLQIEALGNGNAEGEKLRVVAQAKGGKLAGHSARILDENRELSGFPDQRSKVSVSLEKVCEFRVPLALLNAKVGDALRLRVNYWQDGLPIDSLPPEGAIELKVRSEEEMAAVASESWKV